MKKGASLLLPCMHRPMQCSRALNRPVCSRKFLAEESESLGLFTKFGANLIFKSSQGNPQGLEKKNVFKKSKVNREF